MKIICIYTECRCEYHERACEYGYYELGYDRECKYYKCPSDNGTRTEEGHIRINTSCTRRKYVRCAFEKDYKRFEYSDDNGLVLGKKHILEEQIRFLKIGDTVMIKR